jgi:2'-5' RNA ligase
MRPVDPDKQHITLKFLGDPGTSAEEVKEAVSSIGRDHDPFEMRIHGHGAFPNWKRPSVLWIGLRPVDPLRALAEDVDRKIHDSIGTDMERRKFRGHITIARYKGRAPLDHRTPRDLLEEAVNDLIGRDYVIPVNEFHLINSTLTSAGPVYRKLFSFKLQGNEE